MLFIKFSYVKDISLLLSSMTIYLEKKQLYEIFSNLKKDNTLAKNLQLLYPLSVFNRELILRTFFELKEHNKFLQILNTIYNCFYMNYIGVLITDNSVKFPFDLWYFSDFPTVGLLRTNNVSEIYIIPLLHHF